MSRRVIVGVFERESDVVAATRAARAGGYVIEDVYTPYAVHGLDRAMGLEPSWLPWVCLAFGASGTVFAIWLQFWTSAVAWPINVGGRPWNSLPAFVPVIFELMVLAAGMTAPVRMWANVLLAGYALAGLGLAATFFIALCYVADATWAVAFRRVPEALSRVLPASAVLLGVVFLLYQALYSWTGAGGDGLTGFKRFWLDRPFFLIRFVVYFTVWIAFASALVRHSRRQDDDGSLQWTRRNARVSAAFLVLFAVTVGVKSGFYIAMRPSA